MINHDLKFEMANSFTWPPQSGLRLPIDQEFRNQSACIGHSCIFPDSANMPELIEIVRSLYSNIGNVQYILGVPSRVSSVSVLAGIREGIGETVVDENRMLMMQHTAGIKARQTMNTTGNEWGSASPSMQGLLYAALLYTWTAFEVLATDLWIKAIDLRPKSLATNVVTAGVKKKDPAIKFTSLVAYGFNTSADMGKFLKNEDFVSLDSLKGISAAYTAAFLHPDDPKMNTSNTLTHLMNSFFGEMSCLESIRNLIAHRGGIVDKRFLDQVTQHSSSLARLPIGSRFPADGEMVAGYIRIVITASLGLLGFVSDWINKYSE